MIEEQDIIRYFRKVHEEPPRDAWLIQARQDFFSHMQKNGRAEKDATFSIFSFFQRFAMPQLAISALLLLLFIGGIGAASKMFLTGVSPSSFLYPLKLAGERVKETLVFTDSQKADYGLSLAQERIQELTLLSKETQSGQDAHQTALIAQTLQRYVQALGDSARTVKQMKTSGNNGLARRNAEKLDKTARAYTVLLSQFDTASSSLPVFKDAKEASEEAQSTAKEILNATSDLDASPEPANTSENETTSSDVLQAGSAEPKTDGASQTPMPSPTTTTAQEKPSILPNTVE